MKGAGIEKQRFRFYIKEEAITAKGNHNDWGSGS
jgi:hypothetical protein